MKKSFIAIIVVCLSMLVIGCNSSTSAPKPSAADVDKSLQTTIEGIMAARDLDVAVEVENLKAIEGSDFYYYRINLISGDGATVQPQFMFYNGTYSTDDLQLLADSRSLAKELGFEFAPKVEIDTTNMTLSYGNPETAKYTVVEVTNFECPYCLRMHMFLNQLLAERDDVAIYINHLPYANSEKSLALVKIYEAGKIMGQDFKSELFTNSTVKAMELNDIIAYFAAKSGDAEQFKTLMDSDEVTKKIIDSQMFVAAHQINGTPVLFVNGKKVEGFDAAMVETALNQ